MIEFKDFDSFRPFGVELEVSEDKNRQYIKSIISSLTDRHVIVTSWDQTNSNKYWHIKHDSTCGLNGTGWEIASFKARGISDIQHIEAVANGLKRGDVSVNNKCGLHVHVDISDFDLYRIEVLGVFWLKIEKMIFDMLPDSRQNNVYCKKLYKYRHQFISCSPGEVWREFYPSDLSVHHNLDKRVSMNLVNYFAAKKYTTSSRGTRTTVEFRMPEGTVDGDDISNWIKLLVNFVDFVKYRPLPLNACPIVDDLDLFLCYLNLSAYKVGDFYIMGKDLYATKLWVLKRLIAYSNSKKLRLQAIKKLDFLTK